MIAGCHVAGPLTPAPATCTGTLDDRVACTLDSCPVAGGAYQHLPYDGLCSSEQVCNATLGCVARPATCPVSCDDSVACTADSCVDSRCVHAFNDAACGADAECTVTGCVSITPPPPVDGFACVFTDGAHRIGYAVRVRASGMTGVRTVPSNTGETRAMSASFTRLWALGTPEGSVGGGGIETGTDGWTTYSLVGTAGGGINAHPFIERWRYGAPEFNRDILNVADLRFFQGQTCDDIGVDVEVCMNPSGCVSSGWVALPSRFCTVAPDTVGRQFWSADPVLDPAVRGSVAIRLVIWTNGSNDTAACVPAP